ncbi:SRPBCC domain-containing protein [Natronorarus salvus]|uniref:SRPBCC domain-containing protein n=1 Tax=Natronorarus salvus TaxID=3117733 RepID=UPI002F26CEF0
MRTIETEIEIDASPEEVWDVLVDFESYPEWNPLLTWIDGEATPGARLRVRIEPPGSRGMTFRPRLVVAEPNRRLEWLGRLLVPHVFDGRHEFRLEPVGERTRFVHRETFSGLLMPAVLDGEGVKAGFRAMNRALKARVEGDEPSD